jgi:hypothetical protein
MNYPFIVLGSSCVILWLAAEAGNYLRYRISAVREDERDDLGLVTSATLTLLGLLIGFTFSMALSRYDQRKDYEEAEAKTDLLPPVCASEARELLREYVDKRILFYTIRDRKRLVAIDRDTTTLQHRLWAAVLPAASSNPTPIIGLALSGMNDVLNSQGYTQAAWLNRIPIAAWSLMAAVGMFCNLLIGYRSRSRDWRIFVVLPVMVSIAFFLIADIDSPRGGHILIAPQNLEILAQAMRSK